MNALKLSTLSLLLCSSISFASSGAGTTGAQILNIPVGARAVSMGDAHTALADDASSLYWNPAGLGILQQSHASFMYNQNIQDQTYSHVGVAVPMEMGGFGASISHLGYGDIKGFDDNGIEQGNVSAYSAVMTVGGAFASDYYSIGMNVKGLQSKLADVSANAFAADFGVQAIYPEEVLGGTLRFGATYRNLGTSLKFIEQKDQLPRNWKLGVAALQMLDKRLNLALDYGHGNDESSVINAGAEVFFSKYLALRAGYLKSDVEGNGLRGGLGLKVGDVSFDYAFASLGDLGLSHRYELGLHFGEIRPLLSPEERKLLRRAKLAIDQQQYSEAVLLLDSLMTLVPNYKPVRSLMKVAMKAQESTERTAKANLQFQYKERLSGNGPDNGQFAELNDIENLIKSADNALNPDLAQTVYEVKEK